MPQEPAIERAEIREIRWLDGRDEPEEVPETPPVRVQFNPQTLKVNYTNQKAGGDQPEGSAVQFVGRGTTKLAVDLLFDVTGPPDDDGEPVNDVRKLTEKLFYFMKPKPTDEQDKFVPPGVRFLWGSFLFDGVMDSMNETLDFFSSDGRPLRATVSIALSQQELRFRFNEGAGAAAGTQPQAEARAGDSVQQLAARQGRPGDWKAIAAANDIENPRNLTPGLRLSLTKPSVSVNAPRASVQGPSASAGTPAASVQTGFGGRGGLSGSLG